MINLIVKNLSFLAFLLVYGLSCSPVKEKQAISDGGEVSAWITTRDQKSLLTKQSIPLSFDSDSVFTEVIEVDTTVSIHWRVWICPYGWQRLFNQPKTFPSQKGRVVEGVVSKGGNRNRR
jgi:hypothetical protein